MKTFLFLTLLIIGSLLLYYTSFTNSLYQDDFFNIYLSQKQTLLDSFNILKKPILEFYFYRPLTTQSFWKLGYSAFGVSPLGYHVVLFLVFALTGVLFYKFLLDNSTKKIAALGVFFYMLSANHFYRLYFLSQFQEIGLAFFTLLTIILFPKRPILSIVSFLLALACKETAVVIPFFLLTYCLLLKKGNIKTVIALFIVVACYLTTRVLFFGFSSGNEYAFNLNPLKVANNYLWYTLWSIGVPETFVNVKLFAFPTILNPKLFTEFGEGGKVFLVIFALFLLFMGVFRKGLTGFKRYWKLGIIGGTFFIIFLLPVAFFPFHKFPYSLTIPLMGISLLLAIFFSSLTLWQKGVGLSLFLLVSITSVAFNTNSHWSVNRSETAKAVFNFFERKFPEKPAHKNIYFRNNDWPYCAPIRKGINPSSDVAYSIGGVHGLRLKYGDDSIPIYFEDDDRNSHLYLDSLMLDSRKFMR